MGGGASHERRSAFSPGCRYGGRTPASDVYPVQLILPGDVRGVKTLPHLAKAVRNSDRCARAQRAVRTMLSNTNLEAARKPPAHLEGTISGVEPP